MSSRLVQLIALTCCLLIACQSRTVLVQAPPIPTPTAAPPSQVAATPNALAAPVGPVATPVAEVTPASVASPVAASAVAASPAAPSCQYTATRRFSEIQDRDLREASGLAASQRWPGVYWSINDSGNSATLYAIDEQGRSRGSFRLDDVDNEDWEAIQVGPGQNGGSAIYIGDIGDNDADRDEIVIYRVPEPEPGPAGDRVAKPRTTEAEAFKVQYPSGGRDAEGLLVHPKTGEILVVTKEVLGRATIYRVPLPLDSTRTVKVEKVADIDMSRVGVKIDVVTDATVSADGSRVTIRTYGNALEYDVPPSASLASIWEQTPRVARLDDGPQGEGITYRADGGALISISEDRPAHLYETRWQC